MRKLLTLGLVLGLIAASLTGPAFAAKKKKAKPVATTLYFHGTSMLGEQDSFPNVAPDAYLPMDTTAPTGGQPKSKQITSYVAGPNFDCAGNRYWPVWTGDLAGAVKGDMKITFNTVATPGNVLIRVWPDVTTQLCNHATLGLTDYPEPAAQLEVAVPPGASTVEAVLKNANFKAVGSLMVQISPVPTDIPDPGGAIFTPFLARVLYDATSHVSKIEFSCTPAAGAKSCA